jgi:hypothetical protein
MQVERSNNSYRPEIRNSEIQKGHYMKSKSWWLPVLITLAVITVIRISAAAGSNAMLPQQDVIRLENRLTQLEQRMYSIETSVRNLEQQTRLAGLSSRSVSTEEIAVMHSEIQTLQRRIIEDECALAKLDERTLTPERRRRTGATSDPCRLNFESPLRLPDH